MSCRELTLFLDLDKFELSIQHENQDLGAFGSEADSFIRQTSRLVVVELLGNLNLSTPN